MQAMPVRHNTAWHREVVLLVPRCHGGVCLRRCLFPRSPVDAVQEWACERATAQVNGPKALAAAGECHGIEECTHATLRALTVPPVGAAVPAVSTAQLDTHAASDAA